MPGQGNQIILLPKGPVALSRLAGIRSRAHGKFGLTSYFSYSISRPADVLRTVQRAILQGRETRDTFRYVDDGLNGLGRTRKVVGLAPGAVPPSVAAKI